MNTDIAKQWILSGFAALFLMLCAGCGCGGRERVMVEIDFSTASEWKYMLGVDIYGVPSPFEPTERFAGSLRTYVQGLPPEKDNGDVFRAGFSDISLVAPFMTEEERLDVIHRLENLIVSLGNDGVMLSDTAGIPGVFSGAWDILRSPARVIPAMPDAMMSVGSTWEREQRFPITLDEGEADGLLYQLYTLDSLYRTPNGIRAAALSWVFTYRVAIVETKRRYPLSGTGRGNAVLDLDRKKLIKSQAVFQVTHSDHRSADINEVVHFEVVE